MSDVNIYTDEECHGYGDLWPRDCAPEQELGPLEVWDDGEV